MKDIEIELVADHGLTQEVKYRAKNKRGFLKLWTEIRSGFPIRARLDAIERFTCKAVISAGGKPTKTQSGFRHVTGAGGRTIQLARAVFYDLHCVREGLNSQPVNAEELARCALNLGQSFSVLQLAWADPLVRTRLAQTAKLKSQGKLNEQQRTDIRKAFDSKGSTPTSTWVIEVAEKYGIGERTVYRTIKKKSAVTVR